MSRLLTVLSHPASAAITTPLAIPGCVLWLDAQDAATIEFSAGFNVNKWHDKSPTINTARLLSGSNPPQYNPGVIGLNRHSAIAFGDGMFMDSSVPVSGSQFFAVLKCDQSNDQTFLGGSEGGAFALNIDVPNLQMQVSSIVDGEDYSYGSPIVTSDLPHAYSFLCDDGANQPRFAVDNTTLAVSGFNEISGVMQTIGGTGGGGGGGFTIGEVIAYAPFLSDSNQAKVFAYLKKKWGTP